MTADAKQGISSLLIQSLKGQNEVKRIVIFGSFFEKEEPNDLDVAIFVDSDEKYLPLAMKYRKLTREIGEQIPMDILPVNREYDGYFLEEINKGRTIYER